MEAFVVILGLLLLACVFACATVLARIRRQQDAITELRQESNLLRQDLDRLRRSALTNSIGGDEDTTPPAETPLPSPSSDTAQHTPTDAADSVLQPDFVSDDELEELIDPTPDEVQPPSVEPSEVTDPPSNETAPKPEMVGSLGAAQEAPTYEEAVQAHAASHRHLLRGLLKQVVH